MSPLQIATSKKPPKTSVSNRRWHTPTSKSNHAIMTGDTRKSEADEEFGVRIPRWNMGIMNDPTTIEVPGSVLLLSSGDHNEPLGMRNTPALTSTASITPASRPASRGRRGSLKKTADGAMILEPQPDESQNDPLNWPAWRRDSALLSLGFYCMVGGGMTPVLAAGFTNVASDFDVSVADIALTTGLYMLGLGVGGVLASPTAILFGKRPVYIFGCLIFIISSVWCAITPDYHSLVAARILQGIALSPIECCPSATIAEIFFLHERAYRIGIYTLLLLGGKNLVPLVSAAIIQSFGWRWVFYIVAMIGGLCFIFLFLFVPETFWDRKAKISQDRGIHPSTMSEDSSLSKYATQDTAVQTHLDNVAETPPPFRAISVTGIPEQSSEKGYTTYLKQQPPQTFVQQLRPWNGRLHNDNWFRVAFRPFILFAYPAVLWSAVVYACSVGWLIVLSESVAEIYRAKDTYNFSALSTGLIYLSPFIGGVLGTAVAGKVSDVIVKFMSSRNGGLYEPEFRLVMAIPIALTTVVGLMGFGWSAQVHDAWIVPTVFFGLISFGCSLGSTTAITFVVDSYRQYAGEALVTLNFSKNVLHGLVFSLFFNKWLAADGSRNVFLIIGSIQLIFLLGTVPMYIYGKRMRMWTVRRNFMERF